MSKTKKPAKKPAKKTAPVAKKATKPVKAKKVSAPKPAKKAPAKSASKVAVKKAVKKVAKPVEKKPVKPAQKAPVAPVKAPAKKSADKVVAKPVVAEKKAAPQKSAPAVKAAPAKAVVAPGKPGKPAPASPAKAKTEAKPRKPSLDHDVAVKIITDHRKSHGQEAPAAKPKKKTGPIAFNLADIEEYLRVRSNQKLNLYIPGQEDTRVSGKAGKNEPKAEIKPVQNRQVTTVSVADLLGFNPFANKNGPTHEEELIPQKFRKYYKLLIELRDHVNEGLATHTEEALKKTGKEDTGDVSAYSQHMADAGSDSFDRDFALSLVNNENEALYEISEAIDRMKDGSYGVCEVTRKPIPHDRLIAVPFTRYSAEGQREIEKNRRRGRRTNGNPLIDMGDGISFGGASDEGESSGEEP